MGFRCVANNLHAGCGSGVGGRRKVAAYKRSLLLHHATRLGTSLGLARNRGKGLAGTGEGFVRTMEGDVCTCAGIECAQLVELRAYGDACTAAGTPGFLRRDSNPRLEPETRIRIERRPRPLRPSPLAPETGSPVAPNFVHPGFGLRLSHPRFELPIRDARSASIITRVGIADLGRATCAPSADTSYSVSAWTRMVNRWQFRSRTAESRGSGQFEACLLSRRLSTPREKTIGGLERRIGERGAGSRA